MNIGFVILFFYRFAGGQSFHGEKRLVLHSSDDVFQELQNIRQEIQALKAENSQLKTSLSALKRDSGSLYTRWGRTTCGANDTEKVYSGYAAGQQYNLPAGPSNFLCLPENPDWAKYVDGIQNIGGRIYGTEYEMHHPDLFDPFPQPMHDEDVPCAVCRSPRTTTIMMPGKTSCYAGWTFEYTGYIMTGYNQEKASSEYSCIDADPEAVFHGEDNKNGKVLYFTEVECGSLPCQEYPNGRELACVVCSK
ncbi:short-chain collagen C4-like [Mercenaria mercenaria]|uniref:short-chain collagen C4-like n=1 Tax=Mercenaria mercenaria TaxID=6596 RepID=UPI00234ED068|nr:short-chain collagen C4-like [Mercenaria mercenaria]